MNLDGAVVEGCDFTRANFDRSTWLGATVFGCAFDGAVLTDARLGDALFVDCTFRGADLRSINLGELATAVGARFIRCDMRESGWDRRDLDGMSLLECKLHGLWGQSIVRRVLVEDADLSLR